jgi:hypothetical protein
MKIINPLYRLHRAFNIASQAIFQFPNYLFTLSCYPPKLGGKRSRCSISSQIGT